MPDFEHLGVFYLGRQYDLAAKKPTDELLLYDAKDLTTHAVCMGMTGSGKTGLCLALLEEAAIDNIPAIIIDPKGDLSNLLLTFPQLRPEDFEPWIDPAEAARTGSTPAQLAGKSAEQWKKGLAEWGQDGERIQRLRDAVDMAIYTPASSAGLPLTVLRSFDAPPASTRENNEALREAVGAAAGGLLGLLGIEADPLKSREQILISSILDRAWRDGQSLDMPALIRAIQSPGFDKFGVIDLESFFPAKERFELAMQLNNLLASPGFSAWMEGEPLDIQRLLYTPEGKPRLSILSLSHLSDQERMFFVTILLSAVISWMRSQSGTSSLRAILYMDEVFGYFPPSKNPPSKGPMLTLLKQARAFGLGIVLATQNPVDLDYKGLANCGTWFLGRLQTERDKQRVLDGLALATGSANSSFDRVEMGRLLSDLGNRVFLMNNVHDDRHSVFQTRWAMSYLRGPLTREQISRLMADHKAQTLAVGAVHGGVASTDSKGICKETIRPVLPPQINEQFACRCTDVPTGAKLQYRPALLGHAKVQFAQAATRVDHWQELSLLLHVDRSIPAETWGKAEQLEEALDLEPQPDAEAGFATLPAEMSQPKRYASLSTALKDHLYRNQKLRLWKCASIKQTSLPEEGEVEFRVRLSQHAREERDAAVEALRQKYAPKHAALNERLRKAQIKVEKEKSQAGEKSLTAALSIGGSILGALFGRKLMSAGNISRAATSMRQASRIARERQDVTDANEGVEVLQQRLADIDAEFKAETARIEAQLAPYQMPLEEVLVKPKKSEINVESVTLVWLPWLVRENGVAEPAY